MIASPKQHCVYHQIYYADDQYKYPFINYIKSIKISVLGMFTIENFNFNVDRSHKKTGEEVYFEGNKKNELNDIKNYLKVIVSDPEKQFFRKELVKKIILYTTSGIDTSRLYPEMVLASSTKDLVEKKLIYLYLSIYSTANENFARMAINTFTKDCSSNNPNIRAFAVRNLANLRFKGRDEYIYPVLMQGMSDFSPLVKKSCVMGLTKLIVQKNRGLQVPIRDEQILNKLYEIIRESDNSLVCSVLEAINEIEQQGIAMSKKLAYYLLSNIASYNDLQLPIILSYIELYQPKNDEEIIHILTILQSKLKSSSTSVVLAIGKIYIKLSKLKPQLQSKIFELLRSSLMSFLNHDIPQLQYVILKHIDSLIVNYGMVYFKKYFKLFFLGVEEPSYNKNIKVRILEKLINKENEADIINEFAEYLSDEDISTQTVQAFTRILLNSDPREAKFIVKTIIRVIEECPRTFLCDNTLPLIRNYLRLYPEDFNMFANIFYSLIENAKEEESRCAAVEIIGDYGEHIEDAVELLAWNKTQISDNLKVSLLRANVKLFLKRPNEMFNALSNIFKHILTDDQTHLHVKDYAAYLYRGLSSGVKQFKTTFLEYRRQQKNKKQELKVQFQFNTLEVIYRAKYEKWALNKLKYIEVEEEMPLTIEPDTETAQSDPVTSKDVDINMDSKFKTLQADNFDVTFVLTAEEFQKAWTEYDIGSSITRVVQNLQLINEQNLEELFKAWNITVLAISETEEEIKLYNYCRIQEISGDLGVACMQFCINKQSEILTLQIRSEDDELAGFISRYIEQFLKFNQII